MTIPTGRESDKFMLRLPDGMRDRIKAAAETNNRSMNAEIVAVLTDAFPPQGLTIEEAVIAITKDGKPREAFISGQRLWIAYDHEGIIRITDGQLGAWAHDGSGPRRHIPYTNKPGGKNPDTDDSCQ